MKKAKNKSNLSIIRDYLEGNRPFTQFGWSPDSDVVNKKEGEIWEDSTGKQWIKKNGVKKRINKRPQIENNLYCSDCKMNMKFSKKSDWSVFKTTKRCYDCQIQYEISLTDSGKNNHNEIMIQKLKKDLDFCKELKLKIAESISFLKSNEKLTYFNDDGSEEHWGYSVREKLLDVAEKDLKECDDKIMEIQNSINTLCPTVK